VRTFRPFALVTLGVVLAGLLSAKAVASCGETSIAELAETADVVVYGTVTEIRQTSATEIGVVRLRVERVLKGAVQAQIDVAIGPKSQPLDSTDYVGAQPGEKHTLYLYSADNDPWTTNLRIGSHAGAPTAEETAYFGPGREPAVQGSVGKPAVVGSGREFSGTRSPAPRAGDASFALGAFTIAAIALAVAVFARRVTQGPRR
jgi:hypothetical protein